MAVKKKAKKKATAVKNPLAEMKAKLAAVKAETKEVVSRADALVKAMAPKPAPAAKKPAAKKKSRKKRVAKKK